MSNKNHHSPSQAERADSEQENISDHVHHINVSVPLHVAGVTTFEELILPVSISFEDFYSKVCAKMDLEPQTTSLGYRFNKDLRRTPYKDLTNEHHLHAAMNKGADLIDRARTRRVVLEIQNMQQAHQNTAGQKRSAGGVHTAESRVDKEPKVIKTQPSMASLHPQAPATNINIANHAPFSEIGGRRRINAHASPPHDQPANYSHTSSSPSDPLTIPNIEYPAISDVLEELHRIFPALDLPQYGLALSNHRIVTVDDIRSTSKDLLIDIGMPPTIFDIFYDCAMRSVLVAEGYGVSQPRY